MSHTARGSSFVCSSAGANASDRKYWSLLPPFSSRITRMKQVPRKEGVHVLTQPLKPPGFPDIRLSMAAVELEHESGLALIGALAPTNELLSHIEMLGKPVRHIILPNTSPEHWIYGPDISRSYPDAKMWVVKGFMEGKGVPLPGRSLLFREAQDDAEFDMVLAAHGTPIVADGKHQFRQCFEFLFD